MTSIVNINEDACDCESCLGQEEVICDSGNPCMDCLGCDERRDAEKELMFDSWAVIGRR